MELNSNFLGGGGGVKKKKNLSWGEFGYFLEPAGTAQCLIEIKLQV